MAASLAAGLFTIFLMVEGCEPAPQEPASLAAGRAAPSQQQHSVADMWAVDPSEPGPDLPPVGRSLFDALVTDVSGGQARYAVPFPFTALVQRIERALAPAELGSPLKRVLIPLNRSLQRHAAAPEYFRYPRAVLGVDGQPPLRPEVSGIYLKDRLFLGYQEKANVLEVISYNEAAGRFEFQVVRDYGPGKTPTVFYANRALCTACHQNQSPIFSRPLWDETNANPAIAARLEHERRDFYRFPVRQGIDIPNALDEATDRANQFSAFQLLWQEGCERAGSPNDSIACRAAVFQFLLQARLSGSPSGFTHSADYIEKFLPDFIRAWTTRWPRGLRIPNPDLLNRQLPGLGQAGAMAAGRAVPIGQYRDTGEPIGTGAVFEPTSLREPLELWRVSPTDYAAVDRFIMGLSEFISDVDIERLDHELSRQGTPASRPARRYTSACDIDVRQRGRSVDRLLLRCRAATGQESKGGDGFSMEGVLYVKGGQVIGGTIGQVTTNHGDELTDLTVTGGTLAAGGDRYHGRMEVRQRQPRLHARLAHGDAIRGITFQFEMPGKRSSASPHETVHGSAAMAVSQDAAPLDRAIDAMARNTASGQSDVFSRRPFRRVSLMKALYQELNMPPLAWCCEDARGMPDAIATDGLAHDSVSGAHSGIIPPAIRVFHRYCAQCHHEDVPFPPNFLHGSTEQVQDQLKHCAERIFYRLHMWELPADQRPEAPMPPATALQRLHLTADQWSGHADLALLKSYSADFIASQTGKPVRLEDLVVKGYDHLQTCLPSAGSPGPRGPDRPPT